MSIIGILLLCVCMLATSKTGDSNFLILGGLLFVGCCILDVPRILFKNIQNILNNLKDLLNNKNVD